MSEQQQQEEQVAAGEGLVVTPEEKAAIEKGQQGLSEVNPNAPPPPSGPQRPENVPEKFWKDGKVDTEALVASYTALEAKLGAPKEEPAADAPKADEGATRADGKIEKKEGEEAADEGKPNPLTEAMERARDEWATSQEVSEDARKALEDAGIPAAILDLYLDGIRAQTEKVVGEIHTIAGGKDAYEAMTSWAARTLSQEEVDAFNDALDNPAARENAILGLQAKFSKANPSEGKLVIPNDGGASPGDVFTTKDDLVAAQRDPRYGTDANYRNEVMQKLARSQKAGFKLVDRPKFERQIFSN